MILEKGEKRHDFIICGGDFNARIGETNDYVEGIDHAKPRIILDKKIHKHAEPHIENWETTFLKMDSSHCYHSEHSYNRCLQTPNVGHIGIQTPENCKNQEINRIQLKNLTELSNYVH